MRPAGHRAVDCCLYGWFLEGVAIWQAGESVVGRLEAAHLAALTGSLAELRTLDTAFPSRGPAVGRAYAQSALFVRWLVAEYGEHRLQQLFERLRDGATFQQAFVGAFHQPVEPLETRWRASLERSSHAIVLMRDGTVLWVLMGFLFVVASVVSMRRRRRRLDAMEDEETAAAAAEVAWADLQADRDLGHEPTLH